MFVASSIRRLGGMYHYGSVDVMQGDPSKEEGETCVQTWFDKIEIPMLLKTQ